MKVHRILATKSTGVITVLPDATVREAVALLARHRIGALVVVDGEGKIAGIFSERDVIMHAADGEDIFGRSVSDVMTADVVVGMPQDDIMSVAHVMTERRFRHVPIVDGDDLIGIVSIGDVLKAQRDVYRGEIDTLETQLMADEQ